MNLWDNFYTAVAGASATLSGLIFVGVSISLSKILSIKGLANRALISLVLLLTVLLISLSQLIPAPDVVGHGYITLIIMALAWPAVLILDVKNLRTRPTQYKRQYYFSMALDQVATGLFVVAGIASTCSSTHAAYWYVPAIFIAILKAVTDGWVLLVEIHR